MNMIVKNACIAYVLCFAISGLSQSSNKQGVSHAASQPQTQTFVTYQNSPEHQGAKESGEDLKVQQQLARFTEYLVWVGGLQLLVLAVQAVILAVQARLFRRQTGIMKEHKVSLEQLATAGRAWLLVKRTITQDQVQDPYLPSVEQMAFQQRVPNCIFTLKNYGKTPARVVALNYELQVGNSPDTNPDPSVYEMTNLPTLTPDLIPQDTSAAQEARFKTIPSQQDITDIQRGTKFLWLCGTIWYEDVFGRGEASKHKTVFCYLWEARTTLPSPVWIVAGPGKYTDAT